MKKVTVINKQKVLSQDVLILYLLFAVSVASIYLVPRIVAFVLQIIFLVVFYRTKKDYLWLALVFIIENFPGGLFSRYSSDIIHTFSFLPNSPIGTLYFWMMFVLIAFLKSLTIKKSNYKFIFKENFIFIFGYFLFLVLVFGVYKYTAVARTLLPWLFLFIFPRLLRKEEDFARFFNLVFSFVFLVILTQIFQVVFGITIAKILGGSNIVIVTEELEAAARPVDGIYIPFISIFGALYYLVLKKKYFARNYLMIITGLAIFSIFFTATRSWMISTLFIFGFYVVFIAKAKIAIIQRLVIPILMIVIITQYVPVVRQQIDLAKQRYETIELLLEGDLTAGGTISRLTRRGPAVMEKFSESPLIGWGYGNEARKYTDGHVGNQNLLMHTGVIGYVFWVILWLNFILKMIKLEKSITSANPYKNIPKLFIIMLLGILIINASAQWFGYLLQFNPGFIILFLFTFAGFVYKSALQEQMIIQKYNKNKI